MNNDGRTNPPEPFPGATLVAGARRFMEALVPDLGLLLDDAWAMAGACYDRVGMAPPDRAVFAALSLLPIMRGDGPGPDGMKRYFRADYLTARDREELIAWKADIERHLSGKRATDWGSGLAKLKRREEASGGARFHKAAEAMIQWADIYVTTGGMAPGTEAFLKDLNRKILAPDASVQPGATAGSQGGWRDNGARDEDGDGCTAGLGGVRGRGADGKVAAIRLPP